MSGLINFAVFVDLPGGMFRVMEITYAETEDDIELRIAAFVSEKRTHPVPAGGINYVCVIAETPQLAANVARDKGLCYKSVDEMRQEKLKKLNAHRSGFSQGDDFAQTIHDLFGFHPK
jgi:hypothetical protein